MQVGDTFLNRNTSSPLHLWFVCTHPNASDDVVILNLTDSDNLSDGTCLLSKGDHPFITRDSGIAYGRGQIVKAARLAEMKNSGTITPRQQADAALIDRIRQGALQSPDASTKLQAAINACPWKP